jgi:uncharacterized protein (TIGR03792 family)
VTRHRPGRLPSLLIHLFLLFLVLAGLPGDALAATIQSTGIGDGGVEPTVVEHLRVKVPAGAREAWLQAEQQTWQPWLQRQEGFLGREILWDGEKEEGILLIHWHSRRQWLAIPASEIAAVQRRFEAAARLALARISGSGPDPEATNPFPLVYSGELESLGGAPAPASAEDR